MLRRNSDLLLCVIVAISISGCKASEESIIGLGMMVLIAFLVFWLASVSFPRIQESQPVRNFVKRFRRTIGILASLLMAVCILMAVVSFFVFTGVEILFTGIFTLGIIGAWYLKKWANQTEEEHHPVELKMVLVVVTFIVALLWLILFGKDMLRL